MIKPFKIVLYPEPILSLLCARLTDDQIREGKFNGEDIKEIADRMFLTMRQNKGLGLAAPQVGLPIRMFVAEIMVKNKFLCLMNPTIDSFDGIETGYEGCLSLPGIQAQISRPASIVVSGITPNEIKETYELTGLEARIVQHEMDHLEGRIFIERMKADEYEILIKNLKKVLEIEKKADEEKEVP